MGYVVPPAMRERAFQDGKFIVREVDFDTIGKLCTWILGNRPHKSEFTIVIDSDGGSAGAVAHMIPFLKMFGADFKLTGVAYGECGSAALALLQCCHERVAVDGTAFFIHHITATLKACAYGDDLTQVEKRLNSNRELEELLVKMQSARCAMTRTEWMKLADEGQKTAGSGIMTKRAKKLRLIDKIIDSYPLY